jgi:hypothetical protein
MFFVSYPKIGQYNTTIQNIITGERFVGFSDDGTPIYDGQKKLGTVKFNGTTKLHGSNAAVCMQGDEYWVQSRENVITPVKDNCGCAAHFYGSEKKQIISDIIKDIRKKHDISEDKIVAIFGEWVGPNVQKNVAISKLPTKSFFIFGIRALSKEKKIIDGNEEGVYEFDKWIPIEGINNHSINLYNITDYQQFSIEVDMNDPSHVVEYIQSLVDSVEKECPVAKAFGISGLGEGIVWTTEWKGVRRVFKTKGKEHAVTVHKDGKTVHADTEKVKNIQEFANYSVTEARLEQGLEKVFGKELPNKSKMGDFIKWITNDIVTEEIDAISKNNLSVRDVQGEISKKARDWLLLKIGI